MPVGKGVNMSLIIKKRFVIERSEGLLCIDPEDGLIDVTTNGSDDPHVENLMSFLLADKDVKKLIERRLDVNTRGYKFVPYGYKYYIRRKGGDGKVLLGMDRGFCLRSIKNMRAEDLYGIIEFLRKCDLDIRAGKTDGAYWFL